MAKKLVTFGRDRFRTFTVLAFIAMFIFGFILSGDYGPHYDEPSEIKILQMNIMEAAERFLSPDSELVYRLSDMGIKKISQDSDRDHGIAAYYPFALRLLMGDVLSGSYEFSSVSLPFHYYTFVICFSGVLALYFIVLELFRDRRAAFLSALIFFVSPRFFAEMHYNNKDVVLLCLLLDSSLFGIRATKYRRIWDVLLFSAFSAIAANTKIIGLFFFSVIGLAYILYISLHRLWSGRSIAMACLAIFSFLVLYYLLTPAMWTDPIGFFRHCLNNTFSFSRWSGKVVFEGRIYNVPLESLPGSYVPKLICLTTPVFILILAAAGAFMLVSGLLSALFRRERKLSDQLLFTSMLCLCSFVPVLLAVINPPVIYNGWRHFYFAYGGVLILAAYSLASLPGKWGKASLALTVFCLVFVSVQNMVNHPNQQTYYNILAGSDVENSYELDYWNVSTREGLKLAAGLTDGDIVVSSYLSSDMGLQWGLLTLDDELRSRISIVGPEELDRADYVIENTTYQLYSQDTGTPPGFKYLTGIYAYGNPIVNIYAPAE